MQHCLSVTSLRPALGRAAALAARLGLDSSSRGRFLLFVDEALSNSLRHSKADRVLLSLRRGRRSLSVTVQDNGEPFNPLLAEPKSGYGINLLKKLFRRLHYERRSDSNLLRVEI